MNYYGLMLFNQIRKSVNFEMSEIAVTLCIIWLFMSINEFAEFIAGIFHAVEIFWILSNYIEKISDLIYIMYHVPRSLIFYINAYV